jgi:hypothetical protein
VGAAAEAALVKIAMNEYAVGDVVGALALADPLIRWDDRALDSDGELIWGQEDVLEHVADWIDGWDEYSAKIEDIRQEGDRFVVVYTEYGIDRPTGMAREHHRAAAIKVERGAIVAWARYLSETEAVGAAQAGSGDRF